MEWGRGMDNVLLDEMRGIRSDLRRIEHSKLLRVYDSIPRFLLYNVLRGVAIGFGSVVGATIVVSMFIYLLSGIEFIPLIGDWVGDIVRQVQGEMGRSATPAN